MMIARVPKLFQSDIIRGRGGERSDNRMMALTVRACEEIVERGKRGELG